VLGPAIGGLLGEFGPRVPFWAAAGLAAVNLVYGWFVLPETLAPANRRAFDWRRSNPFATFRVFRTYPGVLPMASVLTAYFFATSVYPAIWAFWGIARFGWSEAMIGLTLACYGLVTAFFQGVLTGPASRLGERRVALAGLGFSAAAALGYGLTESVVVFLLFLLHGPEGFVHPMLTAMMSRAVPEDAQGELQGGLSSLTNIAMLGGTVFYAQVFGHYMRPDAWIVSPGVAFVVAAGLVVVTLVLYAATGRAREGEVRA
jgi:DHA1 family tetracycline resistance protein-like MFS transporter